MNYKQVNSLKSTVVAELHSYKKSRSAIARFPKSQLGLSFSSADRDLSELSGLGISVGFSKYNKNDYRLELLLSEISDRILDFVRQLRNRIGNRSVNVTEVGKISFPSEISKRGFEPFFGPQEQLHIGVSISHKDHCCGTLGAFAERDGENYLLSCNHVLTNLGTLVNQNLTSKKIYHPGQIHNRQISSNDHVANVDNWLELSSNSLNMYDFAYAKLLDHISIRGNIIPEGYGFPFAGEQIKIASKELIDSLEKNTIVHKIGCSTQFTNGRIQQLAIEEVPVFDGENNIYKFTDVYRVGWSDNTAFSAPGDSGALVFARINGTLWGLGLIFAGFDSSNPETGSYFYPLASIMEQHNLKFL